MSKYLLSPLPLSRSLSQQRADNCVCRCEGSVLRTICADQCDNGIMRTWCSNSLRKCVGACVGNQCVGYCRPSDPKGGIAGQSKIEFEARQRRARGLDI
jgi:hypothetical protein